MAVSQEFNDTIMVHGDVIGTNVVGASITATNDIFAKTANIGGAFSADSIVSRGNIDCQAASISGSLSASFLQSTGSNKRQTMSQDAITNAIKSISGLNAYPVGAYYISDSATSPASLFGGTWQQLTEDAYLKIVTSGAGALGGTSSHKMPAEALPNHVHPIYCVTSVNTSTTGNHALGTLHSGARNHDQYTLPNSDSAQQPYYPYYYGIYAWRRIA